MAYTNPEPKLEDIDEITTTDNSEVDYTPIEQVYFAFIDVLGFKQAFDDIRVSGNREKEKVYRDVFNYYFKLMDAAKFMKKGCYAGQTSDSLYFYTNRADFLIQFMKIYSHFSLYAMSKDVFFRGGIAKGNLYKKEDYQFYGNSVIYAYLLESEISKNPIIVIDEKTNEDMKNMPEYKNLVKDEKGRHYIKPFVFLQDEAILDIEGMEKEEIDPEAVKKHIEDNRRLFEYDARNYAKYDFLHEALNECNKLA